MMVFLIFFKDKALAHDSHSHVLFRQTLVQKRHLEREEELQSELEELGENLETELGEEVVYLMFIFVSAVLSMFFLVLFMFSLVSCAVYVGLGGAHREIGVFHGGHHLGLGDVHGGLANVHGLGLGDIHGGLSHLQNGLGVVHVE